MFPGTDDDQGHHPTRSSLVKVLLSQSQSPPGPPPPLPPSYEGPPLGVLELVVLVEVGAPAMPMAEVSVGDKTYIGQLKK